MPSPAVRVIDEESSRLDLLIGEAVEMAEIDANVVQVKMSSVHPRALLDHAVEESRKILAGHKVTILPDASGADPMATILRGSIRTCWAGSSTSARKCGQPHASRIARHAQSKRSDDRVEFYVEDNGPGIDAVDLPLIFEKFYRGKRSKRKGSGMGLAISRAILKAHGGGIEAASSPVAERVFISGCR